MLLVFYLPNKRRLFKTYSIRVTSHHDGRNLSPTHTARNETNWPGSQKHTPSSWKLKNGLHWASRSQGWERVRHDFLDVGAEVWGRCALGPLAPIKSQSTWTYSGPIAAASIHVQVEPLFSFSESVGEGLVRCMCALQFIPFVKIASFSKLNDSTVTLELLWHTRVISVAVSVKQACP